MLSVTELILEMTTSYRGHVIGMLPLLWDLEAYVGAKPLTLGLQSRGITDQGHGMSRHTKFRPSVRSYHYSALGPALQHMGLWGTSSIQTIEVKRGVRGGRRSELEMCKIQQPYWEERSRQPCLFAL